MCTQPMIFPLDVYGKIYVLQDEKGNTIGTGTREVCGLLLYMISKTAAPFNWSQSSAVDVSFRPNVRAAVTI